MKEVIDLDDEKKKRRIHPKGLLRELYLCEYLCNCRWMWYI